MTQSRVVDDAGNGLQPEMAVTDTLVTVLATAQRVHAIVEMDGVQAVEVPAAVLRPYLADDVRGLFSP